MRHVLLPASILVLSLACGSSRLSQREADKDIAQDYPVVVTEDFPQRASAIKGSPQHAKLVALQEALKKHPFTVSRSPEGDREVFTFTVNPGAPANLQPTGGNYLVPVAQAEFVRTTKMKSGKGGAEVAYLIRLAKPTEFFPIFQITHPKAQVGQTQERVATYVKEGSKWILNGTNERYKKAGK